MQFCFLCFVFSLRSKTKHKKQNSISTYPLCTTAKSETENVRERFFSERYFVFVDNDNFQNIKKIETLNEKFINF